VWVDAAADPGGDGSAERPFTSVQEGADAAGRAGGGLVAVAEGTYAETLDFDADHGGVTVQGRCASLVHLDASGGPDDWPAVALEARGAKVEVGGITVADARFAGVGVLAGTLTVSDVWVERPTYAGLYVEGSRAVAVVDGLRVADVLPLTGYASGFGIQVRAGAVLDAREVELTGTTTAGIHVYEEAEAALTGLRVDGVEPEPGRSGGESRGVYAAEGAVVSISDAELSGAAGYGVAVASGASVELAEVRVHDLQPGTEGSAGGFVVVDGSVEGTGLTVEGFTGSGLMVVGGEVNVVGFVARDLVAPGPDSPAAAIWVGDGHAEVAGAEVSLVEGAAAWALETGTIALSDLEVHDLRSASGAPTLAIVAMDGGTVEVEDATLDPGAAAAAVAAGAGALVRLNRVDARSDADAGGYAEPIVVVAGEAGGRLELVSTQISGNAAAGISANGGEVWVEDVHVEGLRDPSGVYGIGASAVLGGTLSGDGLTVTEIDVVALSASDASVDLAGLEVVGPMRTGSARGLDQLGGTVRLVEPSFSAFDGMGLVATGGLLELEGGYVGDLGRPSEEAVAVGVAVQNQAELRASGLQIRGIAGPGLHVLRSDADCERCEVREAHFAGLVVVDGVLSLQDGVVEGNGSDDQLGGGVGVYVLATAAPTSLAVTGTHIGPHPYAGIWSEGASVAATDVDLSGGPGSTSASTAPCRATRCTSGPATSPSPAAPSTTPTSPSCSTARPPCWTGSAGPTTGWTCSSRDAEAGCPNWETWRPSSWSAPSTTPWSPRFPTRSSPSIPFPSRRRRGLRTRLRLPPPS